MREARAFRKLFEKDIEPEILKVNDYLKEEVSTLLAELAKHGLKPKLSEERRKRLAVLGYDLKPATRKEYVQIVKVNTLIGWHRRLVRKIYDSSDKQPDEPKKDKRKKITPEQKELILQIARENRSWGYLRIVDTMMNLGHDVSKSSVKRLLKKEGLRPLPNDGDGSWAQFLKTHADVIWQADFKTTHIWTFRGLVAIDILFFINIATRKVVLGGFTEHATSDWMKQTARNLSGWGGELEHAKYIIRDRDGKYQGGFDEVFAGAGIKVKKTCVRAPDMNAFIERYIKSIKVEMLDHLILFGERQLAYVLKEYLEHYHTERNHQGLEGNVTPVENEKFKRRGGKVYKSSRLGGLLNTYYRSEDEEAA